MLFLKKRNVKPKLKAFNVANFLSSEKAKFRRVKRTLRQVSDWESLKSFCAVS